MKVCNPNPFHLDTTMFFFFNLFFVGGGGFYNFAPLANCVCCISIPACGHITCAQQRNGWLTYAQ